MLSRARLLLRCLEKREIALQKKLIRNERQNLQYSLRDRITFPSLRQHGARDISPEQERVMQRARAIL